MINAIMNFFIGLIVVFMMFMFATYTTAFIGELDVTRGWLAIGWIGSMVFGFVFSYNQYEWENNEVIGGEFFKALVYKK